MMMERNTAAIELLTSKGWIRADEVVSDLIEAGIIEADPMTEAERIAQAAKNWIGGNLSTNAKTCFEYASGWTTSSWEYVLGEQFEDSNPLMSRDIFRALVILAKEAKIEL